VEPDHDHGGLKGRAAADSRPDAPSAHEHRPRRALLERSSAHDVVGSQIFLPENSDAVSRWALSWRAMKLALVIVVACNMLGCATSGPALRWDRPGATDREFLRDRYACVQDAREPVAVGGIATVRVNGIIFGACMVARGYTRNPDGQFGPPPGDAIMIKGGSL